MRESKVTDQELNWMYAALVKKQVMEEQFNGGAFQQYYDQGYNARANQGD